MQKQIVIASLLGSAMATAVVADAPCVDMVTKVWTAKQAKLVGATAALTDASAAAKKSSAAGVAANDLAKKTLKDYKATVQKILDNYSTINLLKTNTDKEVGANAGLIVTSD